MTGRGIDHSKGLPARHTHTHTHTFPEWLVQDVQGSIASRFVLVHLEALQGTAGQVRHDGEGAALPPPTVHTQSTRRRTASTAAAA